MGSWGYAKRDAFSSVLGTRLPRERLSFQRDSRPHTRNERQHPSK